MFHPDDRLRAELLLIAGVVVQYIATRLALASIARGDAATAGRQAVAQWLPIGATALAAVILKQPEIAVALIFGSSVASLSLVMGLTSYAAPIVRLPASRRVWPLVVPAAILVLIAGFHAHFTWYHAVMLLVMGAAFLGVWLDLPNDDTASAPTPAAADHTVGWFLFIPALVLVAGGAWAAIKGVVVTSALSRKLNADLLTATMLSPLLLLPAVGSGTLIAQRGYTGRFVTSLCGTVLLNLCLLLPAVILINLCTGAQTGPVLFPLITWRVDAVVLFILGLTLVPIAAGRWVPERIESVLLIGLYVAYLVAEAWLSIRLLG